MLLSQILKHPKFSESTTTGNTNFVMPFLNEIKSENIRFLVSLSGTDGVNGYVVFYEDENIYACPGCGHHISNTFSYCPNCAHKMSPEVDAPLKCPNCNNSVAYTFEYCPHCSKELQ